MEQESKQDLKSKIAAIRADALAQWRGEPLCYANMSPECRVAYLMGRLDELENGTL